METFGTIFRVLVFCGLGLVGGGWSAHLALENNFLMQEISRGDWKAYPGLAAVDAGPYSNAKYAQQSTLPLGKAEGILFAAGTDADGTELQQNCTYKIVGTLPTARVWTLAALNQMGQSVQSQNAPQVSFHSQSVIYGADDLVTITVGPVPAPGNWLAVDGKGPMLLALRLYDTTVTSSTGASNFTLPRILRLGCK